MNFKQNTEYSSSYQLNESEDNNNIVDGLVLNFVVTSLYITHTFYIYFTLQGRY